MIAQAKLVMLMMAGILVAAPAWATDGVIEISQAKVLANGGHFPYVISSSGSYRLTSNLDVTNDPGNATAAENRTAISITAARVTVDLNGFSITGPATCSGTPTQCTPSGSGRGINASGLDTVVRNGTIQGMGNSGVQMLTGTVEGVTVIGNGGLGIDVGTRGLVLRSRASNNDGIGIYNADGTVTECVVNQNNAEYGIVGSGVATHNVVQQTSSGGGMQFLTATVAFNDVSTSNNYALFCSDSTVSNNNVRRSISSPAAALIGSGYSYNRFSVPGATDWVTGGVNVGGNICAGVLCP